VLISGKPEISRGDNSLVVYRAMAEGGYPGGAIDIGGAPGGAAEAVAGGLPPGNTTTRVPTLTRV